MANINEKIEKLNSFKNNGVLDGHFINLIALNKNHLKDVVNIRNEEKSKYFLNQAYDLTLEMQEKWYEDYLLRDNDIYFVISLKDGTIVGTIRLYDIDFNKNICEEGSFIISEKYSGGTPYCLEAKLLLFDFAFFDLGMEEVINENKSDNENMNNISKKMGFKFIKNTIIRDIEYNYMVLNKSDYKGEKLHHTLDVLSKMQ